MTDVLHLIRYEAHPASAYGILKGDEIYEAMGHPPFGAITRGLLVGPVSTLTLLPPVQPGKIVAVGRNYAAHAQEHDAEVPEEPLLFLKAPSSIIGPGEAIVLPSLSAQVEHEAELALVIGRRCRHVPEAEAWQVIAGVTAANDVTARDLQRRDGQWARAKSFDTFCPLGPALALGFTPDEVGALILSCRVNGELRQQGHTAQMVFSIPRLIAHATAVMTLEPGDVLLTGTPAGVGPLRPGDIVEVALEGVGRLHNPVVGG